jgi:FtsH-binding integral membrane protein
MADFVALFVFCQALGAFIGAITALWGEFAYIRAIRDGKIDVAERSHLDTIARGLRFGMTLLLLSSLGLVVLAYTMHVVPQPALTTSYWIFVMLAFLITGISWALSRKKVSFAFGSAVIFTGWLFLSYLTLGLLPAMSFSSAVALFVIAVAIVYALLYYLRLLTNHFYQSAQTLDKK